MTYKIAKNFIREKIFLLKTQNLLIANISTYMVIELQLIFFISTVNKILSHAIIIHKLIVTDHAHSKNIDTKIFI